MNYKNQVKKGFSRKYINNNIIVYIFFLGRKL